MSRNSARLEGEKGKRKERGKRKEKRDGRESRKQSGRKSSGVGGSYQLGECTPASVPTVRGIVNHASLPLSNACCVQEGPADVSLQE